MVKSGSAPNLQDMVARTPVACRSRSGESSCQARSERVASRRSAVLQVGQSLAGSYMQNAVVGSMHTEGSESAVARVSRAHDLILDIPFCPSSNASLHRLLTELRDCVADKILS